MQATISETVTVGGLTLSETTTVNAENAIIKDVSVPAGKVSQLTTRTDNTTGTVTGPTGHGITTAQVVDLYWVGGARRQVVVGTVSGLLIPISGGVGDVLPANLTAVTICPRTAVNVVIAAADLNFLAMQVPASVRGSFALREGGGAYPINQTQNGVWHWTTGNGEANPLGAYTSTILYMSHDSTVAQKMQFTSLAAA